MTCLDLMVKLYSFFQGEMEREEWRGVRGAMRNAVKEAYERHTRFAYSGSARMKRLDYLLGQMRRLSELSLSMGTQCGCFRCVDGQCPLFVFSSSSSFVSLVTHDGLQ